MNALLFLLPIALVLGGAFAVMFVVAVRRGQFDDLDDPPRRILYDDDPPSPGPRGSDTSRR